jgi:hypothetical protein
MDALGYLQTTAQGLPLSIAMGATPGASIVNKFGFNEAISNTEITLWFQGGLYTYPTDAAGKIDMLLFDN